MGFASSYSFLFINNRKWLLRLKLPRGENQWKNFCKYYFIDAKKSRCNVEIQRKYSLRIAFFSFFIVNDLVVRFMHLPSKQCFIRNMLREKLLTMTEDTYHNALYIEHIDWNVCLFTEMLISSNYKCEHARCTACIKFYKDNMIIGEANCDHKNWSPVGSRAVNPGNEAFHNLFHFWNVLYKNELLFFSFIQIKKRKKNYA